VIGAQHSAGLVALAFFSGLCAAGIGIAYRMGHARGVHPFYIALCMVLAGLVVFGSRCLSVNLGQVPAWVWAVGIVTGLGQYVTMAMVRHALVRGGLTGLWCATGLGFLPATVYARWAFGEQIPPLRGLGVAAGIACVVVASLRQAERAPRVEASSPRGPGGGVAYGAVLLAILLSNGLLSMGIKDLSVRPAGAEASYMARFGDVYYLVLYAVIGVLICVHLWVRKGPGVSLRRLAPVGILAAGGSVLALGSLQACGVLPAALVFTIFGVVSILGAAVVSVIAFGERPTGLWLATVALAVAAVVLVQL